MPNAKWDTHFLGLALKLGLQIEGCSMYIAAQDVATKKVWGGPPYICCAVALIQCGLSDVISSLWGTLLWYAGLYWPRRQSSLGTRGGVALNAP